MQFPCIFLCPIIVTICSCMVMPNCLAISTQNHTSLPSRLPPNESQIDTTLGLAPTSTAQLGPAVSTASTLLEPSTASSSPKFDRSVGVIVFALVGAFFFMGLILMYIRRCTAYDQAQQYQRSMNSIFAVQSALLRQHQRPALENGGASKGLDVRLVRSLPTVNFCKAKEDVEEKTEEVECRVFLSEFEEGEELRVLPACKHSFHLDCIDKWLFSHTTCPLCRCSLLSWEAQTLSLKDMNAPFTVVVL